MPDTRSQEHPLNAVTCEFELCDKACASIEDQEDSLVQSFRIMLAVDGKKLDITDRFQESEIGELADQVIKELWGR